MTDVDEPQAIGNIANRESCWGCEHLGIHDRHYFYCAGQDAPNKHAKEGEYAYPWRGAGKQLRDPKPDRGCPVNASLTLQSRSRTPAL